jgi:hypothetical protein
MSVTTIADLLNPIVPPDSPVQYPLRGRITKAWDVQEDTTGQNRGRSQGFTLTDETGDIGGYYYERQGEIYQPLLAGEVVEICAKIGGKGKLGGAFKKLTGAQCKTPGSPRVYVYGACLSRIGPAGGAYAQAQPATSGGHPAPAQAQRQAVPDPAWMSEPAPPHQPASPPADTWHPASGVPAQFRPQPATPTGKLTETEARELWVRNFHGLASLFGYPDRQVELVAELPPHFATLLAAASTTMLIGIQRGDILRDPIQGGGFDEELGF